MTLSDPIADFLTRIRNAQMARKTSVTMPYSKLKHEIAKTMKKNGFVDTVAKVEDGPFAQLSVDMNKKTLELKRVSKPGQRIYVGSQEVRKVKNGFGIAIISTPKGVMTGYEARAENVGGEFLCTVS